MDEKKRKIITWTLLVVSVIMICIGIYRGEAVAVLNKAIKVCMQCIGIG